MNRASSCRSLGSSQGWNNWPVDTSIALSGAGGQSFFNLKYYALLASDTVKYSRLTLTASSMSLLIASKYRSSLCLYALSQGRIVAAQ